MLVRPGSSRLWKSRWGAGIPANKLSRFTKMRNCPSVEVSTVEGLYNGRVNDHALYSTAPMTRSQFEMEISWNERVSTLLRLWNLDYWRFHSCASSRTDRWYCWRYMNFGRNDPYLREIRALPEDAYLPLGDRAPARRHPDFWKKRTRSCGTECISSWEAFTRLNLVG